MYPHPSQFKIHNKDWFAPISENRTEMLSKAKGTVW